MARVAGFTEQMRKTATLLDGLATLDVVTLGAELDGPGCADLGARLHSACDAAAAHGDDRAEIICSLNEAIVASHVAANAGLCIIYGLID